MENRSKRYLWFMVAVLVGITLCLDCLLTFQPAPPRPPEVRPAPPPPEPAPPPPRSPC